MLGIYRKSLKAGLLMNDSNLQSSIDGKVEKVAPLLNQILINDGTGGLKNSTYNQTDLDVLKADVESILDKKSKIKV
jgi:hypothetical protein